MANMTVKIPDYMYPNWECNINGIRYTYPAGTQQSVPQEVADLIANNNDMRPVPADGGGSAPDMIITIAGHKDDKIVKEHVTVTRGSYEHVKEKLLESRVPDIRVRFIKSGGNMFTADEVRATACYYEGTLIVNYITAPSMSNHVCMGRIGFGKDGAVSSVAVGQVATTTLT